MKTYDLLYIDPPWSYDKKVGRGIADDHYNTMSLGEIKALRINAMLKKDAVVFIWVTFPLLDDALDVIRFWNLEYVTIGFNWIKLNSDGTPFIGTGHHTRSNSELCLLCRKGEGLKVADRSISQVVMTKREAHSKKPHKIYSLLEKLYPDAEKLEMFARHKRENWSVFGNQVPKETQRVLE